MRNGAINCPEWNDASVAREYRYLTCYTLQSLSIFIVYIMPSGVHDLDYELLSTSEVSFEISAMRIRTIDKSVVKNSR